MSVERTFWDAIIASVKANATLTAYVSTWIDGARNRVLIPAELPAVIFQPVAIDDEIIAFPDKCNAGIVFRVVGILRATDVDEMIAGDANNTGILKLDEDLKNALDVYLKTTSPKCYEVKTVSFDLPDNFQAGNTQEAIVTTVIEVKIINALNFKLGAR